MRPSGFDRARKTWSNFLQFFSGGSILWKYRLKPATAALALFAVIAVAMAWRLRSRMFQGRRLFLWLWFIAACAAPSVVDLFQGTYAAREPPFAIAGLPAAYLLAAVGLSCLARRTRLAVLLLVAFAWAPHLADIYREYSRSWQPVREVARELNSSASSSDLILVHSIPSGVIGIARYAEGPAELASWVGQLGTRRVPQSIHKLAAGRTRILLVKMHAVGETTYAEHWLRANALVFQEKRLKSVNVVDFRPAGSETF